MVKPFGRNTLPTLLAGICFLASQTSAHAFTTASGEKDYFAKYAAIDDSTLETIRGGWTLSNGMTIDFALSTRTFVDGMIQNEMKHEFPWLFNNQTSGNGSSSGQGSGGQSNHAAVENQNPVETAGIPQGADDTPWNDTPVAPAATKTAQQTSAPVQTSTPSELVTLIQIGENNTAFADGLPNVSGPLTVIQNTLDNKVIQNLNLLDITASNVNSYKAQGLAASLNHQLVMGLQ